MKSDMGGAAAVIAAIAAIARLEPARQRHRLGADGREHAVRHGPAPSDVSPIYGGKTVEVLNTDAEGRLVLADAIVRAGEDNPDLLIDVATLTGAQLVALGTRTSGVMGNDDDAARRDRRRRPTAAGEPMWPMPLPEELRASLDSDGRRHRQHRRPVRRHARPPALFLQEFVGRRASAGRTSTSPGRRSTTGSRTATRPRAAPGTPSAPSSRWPRTSPPATSPTPDPPQRGPSQMYGS